MKLMKVKFVSPLIIILLFAITACGIGTSDSSEVRLSSKEDSTKDELVLAVGGEPDGGFDPTTGWGRYGSPLFQSTLLKFDQDFNVQLDIANDYEVSDDGLQWTIEIRDDVLFSDGEELTAEDIVFTYETAKDSASVVDLTNLESIEKISDYTIVFKLEQADSTFLHTLTNIGIVPEHLYDDTYYENPIGSGPYQMVQWDKGQQLIVEENPYYYGNKSEFKKLTFLFLSEAAAFAAARAGEVDIVSVTPAFAKEEVAGMKLIALESVDNRGMMLPFVPAGEETETGVPIGNDVTADLAIRYALNVAVDREALVAGVLEGFGTPAYSAVDGLPWWNQDTVLEDANMEKAAKILEEAGWISNNDGIREKDGLLAEFTLYYPSGDQTRQSLSLAFSEMMKPLGIHIHTAGKSWSDLERLMHANPVMMGWGSHNPIEIYHIYSSDLMGVGYYNANYYTNETVDMYMDQALRAINQDEANKYWKLAQWDGETGLSTLGDAPWVWLVNLDHLYFVDEKLHIGKQKVQPHGHGYPITEFIEQWHWDD